MVGDGGADHLIAVRAVDGDGARAGGAGLGEGYSAVGLVQNAPALVVLAGYIDGVNDLFNEPVEVCRLPGLRIETWATRRSPIFPIQFLLAARPNLSGNAFSCPDGILANHSATCPTNE